jgi:transcriptional regulator with XRE-family HTH domain
MSAHVLTYLIDAAENPERFGPALREVRNRAGLSQPQLSRAAEMSQTQISEYERGKHVPALPSLRRLAAALSKGEKKTLKKSRESA